MTILEITAVVIAVLLLLIAYLLWDINVWLEKIQRPPPVEHFSTFEGLLEYCRQHFPNCYQELLWMKESPHWQARLGYSQFRFFDAEKDGIPVYRYFKGLEVSSSGTYYDYERRDMDHRELFSYEEDFISEMRDHDKISDAIERHLPLPPDFRDPDEG